MEKQKIIFIGTPEFAVPILNGLVSSNLRPILVISAPDKPVGRKQIVSSPQVKIAAQKYGISVAQPEKISNFQSEILDINPDLIIVASYAQILPKSILEIPKYGCINIHPSLLPKYRGASPIQYQILNGEKETGTTIILMDEKMDHGKIIAQRKFEIGERKINFKELSERLSELSLSLLLETIPNWTGGKIKAISQDESKATYTKILKKEDGKIDWEKPANEIERKIRALNPWPGTFAFFESKILKILEADILNKKEKPGKVFLDEKKQMAVGCGNESLAVFKIQLEGKRPASGKEFLNGYPSIIGAVLS